MRLRLPFQPFHHTKYQRDSTMVVVQNLLSNTYRRLSHEHLSDDDDDDVFNLILFLTSRVNPG